MYWFTYNDSSGIPRVTLPTAFKGRKVAVDVDVLGKEFSNAKLNVMNKKSGNMAIVDYLAPKSAETAEPIKLNKGSFQYVRSVRLRILSEDRVPLERAVVTITDGEGTKMQTLVTPADEGIAEFNDVAIGEINVKVAAEGARRTMDSDVELPEKRETLGFQTDVRVAGDVDTLQVVPTSTQGKASTSEPSAEGTSMILQTIAGIVFLLIVAAIVYAVVKSKGVTAESALRKMGVQVPGETAASDQSLAPAVDPAVCEFCGQRKDAEGQCACSLGTPSPYAAASAHHFAGPRLIGTQGACAGEVFLLKTGTSIIGREAGNEVVLSNDNTVSRRHAALTIADGAFSLRDLGSSNGTFVNGARVTEASIKPGDEITVGGSKFRFEV